MYIRASRYVRRRIIINKFCAIRTYSTNLGHVDASKAKPFEDIPGPKSLPIIGTLYKYLPLIGEYSFTKMHLNGLSKLKHYGPLVREEIVPGESIIWVFRPEDIVEIFKAEAGLYPERKSHLALLKFRKDKNNVYNTGGLLPTNGMDWWRLRREFQKVLSKPQNVVTYLEDTDLVIQQFVQLCSREKPNTDLLPLLSRLFLELTCLVAFDVRMQSFSEEERRSNSQTSKLIEAALITNDILLRLDNGPRLWRFFKTPLYKKLCEAQNYMEEVALRMVTQRNKDVTSIRRKQSLLDEYLRNDTLDIKDIVGMACDMLLAGMDTTTYSMAFALHYIARNTAIQEKLRSEATSLLVDHTSPVTAEVLRNATYTKAVIKETLRMNPISIGIGRILQRDVILNGYHVPKGIMVVTQNQVICRLSEYFDEPNSFIPERWLRTNTDKKLVHPYLVLPFGHGPRACIARRFAEQNMQVFLLRMCRELQFTWCGKNEPLDLVSALINKPNAAIRLTFKDVREETKI